MSRNGIAFRFNDDIPIFKIVDLANGVESILNGQQTVLKKINENEFNVNSEVFNGRFFYDDVKEPITQTLNEFIDIFISKTKQQQVRDAIGSLSSTVIDEQDKLRTKIGDEGQLSRSTFDTLTSTLESEQTSVRNRIDAFSNQVQTEQQQVRDSLATLASTVIDEQESTREKINKFMERFETISQDRYVRTNFRHITPHYNQIISDNASFSVNIGESKLYEMQIQAENGTRVVSQSLEYTSATLITGTISFLSGILTDGNDSDNVLTRMGIFDDIDDISVGNGGYGIFVQYSTDPDIPKVSIGYREGGNDNYISQENWNVDKLDGNGQSGISLILSEFVVFYFYWRPCVRSKNGGKGVMEVGLFNDGRFWPCHHLGSAMDDCFPHKAPLRWEIRQSRLGNSDKLPSASSTLVKGEGTILRDNNYFQSLRTFFLEPSIIPKEISDQTGSLPICSIRLKQAFNRATIQVTGMQLSNLTRNAAFVRWDLIVNANLENSTFSEHLGNTSMTEVSTSETSSQGGQIIASGILASGRAFEKNLRDNNLTISSSISGEPQILTLVCTFIEDQRERESLICGGLEWIEIF